MRVYLLKPGAGSACCSISTKSLLSKNRGTGVAIATAIFMLRDLNSEAIAVAFPCDHHYSNEAAFLNVIEAGILAARNNPDAIFLVGAEATYPETEYGWIEPVQEIESGTRFGSTRVRRFWEKPALASAQDLLCRGCLWKPASAWSRVPLLCAASCAGTCKTAR